jgi:hypothetical protein
MELGRLQSKTGKSKIYFIILTSPIIKDSPQADKAPHGQKFLCFQKLDTTNQDVSI